MNRLLTLLAVLIIVTATTAVAKDRNWQTGKLIDIGHDSKSGHATGFLTPGGLATRTDVWTVTIDANGLRYVTEGEHVKGQLEVSRGFEPLHILVNDPVKFAVEKDTMFILDTDGKERKLKIIKTVRKEPDTKDTGKQ